MLYSKAQVQKLTERLDEIHGAGWSAKNPTKVEEYMSENWCRDPRGVFDTPPDLAHLPPVLKGISVDTFPEGEDRNFLAKRVITPAALAKLSGESPISLARALKQVGIESYRKKVKGRAQKVYHLRELCLAFGVKNELLDL